MTPSAEPPLYIWICRWPEFQHYAPSRDRGPAWIKDYTAQLDDERYIRLSDRRRALLGDIRRVFATMRGRLPDDARMITRQRCSQTRRVDLDALSDAGFIEFVSRDVLDQRLEDLYASRARARGREEVEKEEEEEEEETPLPIPELEYEHGNGNGAEYDQALERLEQLVAAADAGELTIAKDDIQW